MDKRRNREESQTNRKLDRQTDGQMNISLKRQTIEQIDNLLY